MPFLNGIPANAEYLPTDSLLAISHECDVFLCKQTEEYPEVLRSQTQLYDQFIRKQVTLKNKLHEYFKEQKAKLPYLLNLHKFKGDEFADEWIQQEYWEEENKELSTRLYDYLYPLALIGVMSAGLQYNYTSVLQQEDTKISKILQKQAFKLANDINGTTKELLLNRVKLSVQLGETRVELVKRLDSVLNNVKRAELIAQTESIRFYSEGKLQVGLEVGYENKVWVALFGACKICSDLNGEKVGINEKFSSGALYPPAHPRCKCDVDYL